MLQEILWDINSFSFHVTLRRDSLPATSLLFLLFFNIVKLFLLPTLVLFLLVCDDLFGAWGSSHVGFGVVVCETSGFVLFATPHEVLVFCSLLLSHAEQVIC